MPRIDVTIRPGAVPTPTRILSVTSFGGASVSTGGGSITHGRQINATNTGYTAYFDTTLGRVLAAGDLTTHAGGTISTNGTTLYARDFTNPVTITGNDVTIRGCRMRNAGGVSTKAFWVRGSRCRIEYCTVDPTTNASHGWGILADTTNNGGVGPHYFEYNNITHCGNNISVYSDDVNIRYSYLHEPENFYNQGSGGDHMDGIEVYRGSNVVIQYCRIDDHIEADPNGVYPATINIAPFPGSGGLVDGVNIDDNFLDGGNAHVLVDSQVSPEMAGIKNVRVRRNDMGGHTHPGVFGIYTPLQNWDSGRTVVETLAAQVTTPTAILFPTSGADRNLWAETQTAPALTPNKNGQTVLP